MQRAEPCPLHNQNDDFETMVRLCIEVCEAAIKHGTPTMRAIAQCLLLATGQEVAERIEADESDDA